MEIKYYTKSEPKPISYNEVKPTQIFGLGPYAPNRIIYMKLTNNLCVDLEDGFIEDGNDFSSPVYLYNVEWPNTAEILHSVHINDLKPGDRNLEGTLFYLDNLEVNDNSFTIKRW